MMAAAVAWSPPAMITSIMRTRSGCATRERTLGDRPQQSSAPIAFGGARVPAVPAGGLRTPDLPAGCSGQCAGARRTTSSTVTLVAARTARMIRRSRSSGTVPRVSTKRTTRSPSCVRLGHGRAAARADPVQTIDDALQGVRVVVSTVHDENILGTPGDVELSFVHEAQVSGVEPVAVFGGGTTIRIAVHDAGTLHPDASNLSAREGGTVTPDLDREAAGVAPRSRAPSPRCRAPRDPPTEPSRLKQVEVKTDSESPKETARAASLEPYTGVKAVSRRP